MSKQRHLLLKTASWLKGPKTLDLSLLARKVREHQSRKDHE
jgi:hypothetical protein